MPTFIDESGDTGSIQDGGKPYFRLAAVWVPTLDDAEAFRLEIRRLRQDLGRRLEYEFKFSNTHPHPDRRKAFFAAALTQEFRFPVSLIDKATCPWNSAGSHEQHGACATELAALMRPVFCRAEETRQEPFREPIVVDDNADSASLAVLKRQFHGLKSSVRPGSPLVGKVRFRKSRHEEMIQLVDMVSGRDVETRRLE